MALGWRLEVLAAEVRRLSDENNQLRQQVTAAQRTSRELPATVQTLTAQDRENEALGSAQMILLRTQERVVRHVARVQAAGCGHGLMFTALVPLLEAFKLAVIV